MTNTLPLLLLALLSNVPFIKRRAWKRFYQMFASVAPDDFALMNYGYFASDLPPHLLERPEKYALEMYRRVAAPAQLDGADVLEVGCGRGGGGGYLATQFKPRTYVGIDLSEKAAAICRSRYGAAASFFAGDAQELPFASESFDVVLNVESAFCYPSRQRFYEEVYRVLRSDGLFLCADIEKRGRTDELGEALSQCGFDLVENERINQHVLRACDADAPRRREFIGQLYGRRLLRRPFCNFVALPQSHVYNMLARGDLHYIRFAARKPGRATCPGGST